MSLGTDPRLEDDRGFPNRQADPGWTGQEPIVPSPFFRGFFYGCLIELALVIIVGSVIRWLWR